MHVIITGGSSGIGLEIARAYLRSGEDVSIIARDPARLQDAFRALDAWSGRVKAATGDVCDRIGVARSIRACEQEFGPCDLLITSAGIVEPALFHDLDPGSFEQQFNTNFLGTVNAVRAVYSNMLEREQGAIMLVASAAGHLGIPGYTAYCASKAAVISFADSLRCEAPRGVYVGVCFPPDTKTPQLETELKIRPSAATLLIGNSAPWPVEKVAQQIVKGIAMRRSVIHFGLKLRALAVFGGLIRPVLYGLLERRRLPRRDR
jgi:3-dehydrosphinganine reductase